MLQLFHHHFKAMGSPCSVQLYANEQGQFDRCVGEIVDNISLLEQRYSRYRPSSLVSKINQQAGSGHWIEIDQETAALFNYADTAYQLSDGLFDITTGVLRHIWHFEQLQVPTQKQIDQLLPRIGWHYLARNDQTVRLLHPGMEIDFGGIVKEYAADVGRQIAAQHGIKYGFIELGGDIAILGPKPDGEAWPVGIRHPNLKQQAMAVMPATAGAIATSGDYERFVEIAGKKYSHILSPKTGWPIASFAGVSVWAPQCVVAGTIATIAMLKGVEAGLAWLNASELPYLAVDQQGNCYKKGQSS